MIEEIEERTQERTGTQRWERQLSDDSAIFNRFRWPAHTRLQVVFRHTTHTEVPATYTSSSITQSLAKQLSKHRYKRVKIKLSDDVVSWARSPHAQQPPGLKLPASRSLLDQALTWHHNDRITPSELLPLGSESTKTGVTWPIFQSVVPPVTNKLGGGRWTWTSISLVLCYGSNGFFRMTGTWLPHKSQPRTNDAYTICRYI
jgi:hypothetical protein